MDTNRILRAIMCPFLPAIVAAILGFGFIAGLYQSTAVLDQRVIDEATFAAGTGEELPSLGAPEIVDTSNDPTSTQLGQYLEEVFSGLLTWLGGVVIIGLVVAIIWAVLAAQKQDRVYGPAGQSSFALAWWIAGISYIGAMVAFYVGAIARLDLVSSMDDFYFYSAIFGLGALGLVAFWGATAWAASPVMRPSVPNATWR